MFDRFEQAVLEQGLIADGDRVLCAVSGGADSVALLLLLVQLAGRLGFELQVAHLDHGLRPESVEDARFVAALASSLELPYAQGSVDVRAQAADRGDGLEEAGRAARRAFLERTARVNRCQAIALAHHADDQSETLLLRLSRGSGLTGLQGMQARSGPYIRPLLDFSKQQLVDWLVEQGQNWREDASNRDLTFSRNRVRHRVLPELQQINPQLTAALCRLGRQVQREEEFWEDAVAQFCDRSENCLREGGGLAVAVAALRALHPALRRRVLRGLLQRLRGDLRRIEAVHIDRIEALLASARPQVEVGLPGAWVARRYDRLLLQREAPKLHPFELTITREGVWRLPTGAALRVSLRPAPAAAPGPDVAEFAAGAVALPLTVRAVRPGDRFRPSGMRGRKRLKNYFIDNKTPCEARRSTLLVVAGADIIWLAGTRRCDDFWPVDGEPVLRIELLPADFNDE